MRTLAFLLHHSGRDSTADAPSCPPAASSTRLAIMSRRLRGSTTRTLSVRCESAFLFLCPNSCSKADVFSSPPFPSLVPTAESCRIRTFSGTRRCSLSTSAPWSRKRPRRSFPGALFPFPPYLFNNRIDPSPRTQLEDGRRHAPAESRRTVRTPQAAANVDVLSSLLSRPLRRAFLRALDVVTTAHTPLQLFRCREATPPVQRPSVRLPALLRSLQRRRRSDDSRSTLRSSTSFPLR